MTAAYIDRGSSSLTLMTVSIVSLALLGLVPALIAQRKGRRFWPWFLFGVVLFVPAVIVALLISPAPAANDA